jgi:hypothetical protein
MFKKREKKSTTFHKELLKEDETQATDSVEPTFLTKKRTSQTSQFTVPIYFNI